MSITRPEIDLAGQSPRGRIVVEPTKVVVVVVVMMGFVGVLEVKVLVVAGAAAIEIEITTRKTTH